MSGLSAAEFTCVRKAGFEPVGQVMGNVVQDFRWWHREGDGEGPGHAPLHSRVARYATALQAGRRVCVNRMTAECAALRGDGVVAVRVRVAPCPGTKQALQFTALGAAVQAGASVHLAAPFTAHVSGQDFAKLIMAGWVPAGVVFGVAACWRSWPAGAAPRRRGDGNRELAAWADAVATACWDARDCLLADAKRIGGDGVVLARAERRVSVRKHGPWGAVPGHCVAEFTFTGTVIADFASGRRPSGPVLPVMGLHVPATGA